MRVDVEIALVRELPPDFLDGSALPGELVSAFDDTDRRHCVELEALSPRFAIA
jgi:hypothetical protein